MLNRDNINQSHSNAWIFQTWIAFVLSLSATTIGIFYLPVNNWIKAYMSTAVLFTVSSTVSLSKTQRDLHESTRMIAKIEEAKVEKILSENS